MDSAKERRLLKKNGGTFMGALLLPPGKTVTSITLLMLGLYILHYGMSNQSVYADVIVVGGAVCLALGILMIVFAGRSILAERRMARHFRGR
jgi:protein-S-isoprenylcysteine O-methyltransferase Ste14